MDRVEWTTEVVRPPSAYSEELVTWSGASQSTAAAIVEELEFGVKAQRPEGPSIAVSGAPRCHREPICEAVRADSIYIERQSATHSFPMHQN